MKKILIIGAASAVAQETARCYAAEGAEFFLVGRTEDKLRTLAADLRVYGAARTEAFRLDLNDFERHPAMLAAARQALGHIDLALIAHGSLPDQCACEQSVPLTVQEFSTNGLSVIALATLLGQYFEQERRGCLAVISSVAGDRGRQSNYVYGAAKGAVSIFLQGLRNRLYPAGVQVLTITPGFIDTPMTAALPKNPLYASARQVGEGIHAAVAKGWDIAYLPWYWRFIMMIIKGIPEGLFKRLKL